MPIVQITLVEGRDEATVSRCVKEIARSIHTILDTPLQSVRVMVYQVPPALYSVGDQTRAEIDSAASQGFNDDAQ